MSTPPGKEQRDGPLLGHFKQSRVYKPRLLAYEETVLSDWVRTDFPDLLWPVILVALHGDQGAAGFGKVQALVIEALGQDDLEAAGIALDGRLTSLERIPEEYRPSILEFFRTNPVALGSLPPEVTALPRLYEGVPGAWLIGAGFPGGDNLSPEDAAEFLVQAMVDVVGNRHSNALVKAACFGWMLQRGKVSLVGDSGDALVDYPTNPETRGRADAIILSSFLSFKSMSNEQHPDWEKATIDWAKSFWNQNWSHSPCVPEEILDAADGNARSETEEPVPTTDQESVTDLDGVAEVATQEALALFDAFVNRVLDPELPVDLYAPAKHEVLCGLVCRTARSVFAVLGAPHMWSGEHGSNVMRMLAETRITLGWMNLQDSTVYETFQNYGRGKAKLMVRHMESLLEAAGADAPVDIRELAERLKAKAGGEWGDEFQDVSVEATFSGLSVRQMAKEAGMEDVYRHVYQTTSGVTHGEWWAISDYAMQLCVNPLHLFHLIPSFEMEYPVNSEFGKLLVSQLKGVIHIALTMLAMNKD